MDAPKTRFFTSRARYTLVLIGCSVVGCGRPTGLSGTIPIRGQVMYDGAPVTNGEIRYIPQDPTSGRVARGKLTEDGHFYLTTLKDGDGALPGDYRIVILAAAPPDDSAPTSSSKAGYKIRKDRRAHRDGLGPASQVPLRYTRPDQSRLTDHVDSDHPGFREFQLTDDRPTGPNAAAEGKQ